MALAALGAVTVLHVGSRGAEAAPSVSQFAGTYRGADPRGYSGSWTVTISDAGRITGVRSGFGRDKIGGQVDADGSYAVSVSVTTWVFVHRGHGGGYPETEQRTIHYKSSGTLAPDDGGNLVGTGDRGESFLWVRQ
jgi:hypothetical protein